MRQSKDLQSGTASTLGAAPETSVEEAEFRNNPVKFVELAKDWAQGGEAPTTEHEAWLTAIPKRRIRQPDAAREALWGILSAPERGRALAWLDRIGLLEELIPIWYGEAVPRDLHLRAVEEVHVEHWAKGLSKRALQKLNSYMDRRVDSRLNGWALAALATLIIESNGYTQRYNERLNEELRELGATDSERMRLMTAVIEYPFLRVAFAKNGEYSESSFSPTTVVAALSTLFADKTVPDERRNHAVGLADKMLTR